MKALDFLIMNKSLDRYFRTVLCLFLVFIVFRSIDGREDTFALMTWNILSPQATDVELLFPQTSKQEESKKRLRDIVCTINRQFPDIVCLQEVSDKTLQQLHATGLRPDYKIGSSCRKGHFGGVIVLYNTRRFDMVKWTACPLSSTGAAAGSLLKCKKTDTAVVVCCLHISRENGRAGQEQGERQMSDCFHCIKSNLGLATNDKVACIVAGDFNTYYEEMFDHVHSKKLFDGNWNMFEHGSWTVSSPDRRMQEKADALARQRDQRIAEAVVERKEGSKTVIVRQPELSFRVRCDNTFASIDHILFRNIALISPAVVGNGEYLDADVAHCTAPQLQSLVKKPLVQEVYPSDHLPIVVHFQFTLLAPRVSFLQKMKQYVQTTYQKWKARD